MRCGRCRWCRHATADDEQVVVTEAGRARRGGGHGGPLRIDAQSVMDSERSQIQRSNQSLTVALPRWRREGKRMALKLFECRINNKHRRPGERRDPVAASPGKTLGPGAHRDDEKRGWKIERKASGQKRPIRR